MQHGLGGGIGAWNGRKLGVAPVTLDGEHLARRHRHILGECPVEVRRHPEIAHRAEPVGAHAGANKDTPAEEIAVTAGTIGLDTAAAISALDDRERGRLVPATVGLVLGAVLLRGGQIFSAAGHAR